MFNVFIVFEKKLRSSSLAPKSAKALFCNTFSCLVHMTTVSDFSQTAPNPQDLHQIILLQLLAGFFKLLVAVIILFSQRVSCFLEKSQSVIFALKLP